MRSPFVHLNYPRLITSLSPCRAEVFRQIFDRPPSRPGVVGSSGLGLKQTGWDIDWIFYIKQLLTVIHTKHIMKQKEKWWDFVHIDNRWQSVERKHFKGWKPSRKPKQIQERTDLSNQKVGFPCCNSFVESSAQFEFNTKPMFEKSGCCQLGVCPDTPMSGMLRTSKNYSWMTMSHVLKCVEHGTHKESSSWCFYLSPVSTTKVLHVNRIHSRASALGANWYCVILCKNIITISTCYLHAFSRFSLFAQDLGLLLLCSICGFQGSHQRQPFGEAPGTAWRGMDRQACGRLAVKAWGRGREW